MKLRKSKNMTQQRLAVELGIDQASISSYESGKYLPTVEVLIKLASFFGVSTDYLLGLSDIKVPAKEEGDETSCNFTALFSSLPSHAKERVIGYIEALSDMERMKS